MANGQSLGGGVGRQVDEPEPILSGGGIARSSLAVATNRAPERSI